MKPLLLLLCTATGSALAAADPAPFPDTRIETPTLPLLDAARERLPAIFPEPRQPPPPALYAPLRRPRLTSKMPVVPPREGIDYKLRVARPDESVDYRMLIRCPDAEGPR